MVIWEVEVIAKVVLKLWLEYDLAEARHIVQTDSPNLESVEALKSFETGEIIAFSRNTSHGQ